MNLAEARQRNTERLGEDIKKISSKALDTCEALRQKDMQRMLDAENVAKAYVDQYVGPVSKDLSTSHAYLLKCLNESGARMHQQAKAMDPEGIARKASDMNSLYKQKGSELQQRIALEMLHHRNQAESILKEKQRRINASGKVRAFAEILKMDA